MGSIVGHSFWVRCRDTSLHEAVRDKMVSRDCFLTASEIAPTLCIGLLRGLTARSLRNPWMLLVLNRGEL